MKHLRTISREQPAIAQGLSDIQNKVADILAIVSVISVLQDIFGKGAEDTGT